MFQFVLMVSLLALNLGFVSSKTAQAQHRDCGIIRRTNEPPSSTLRTIRLERFGIQVSIPENYRSMVLQGALSGMVDEVRVVEILHPDDFAMLQCNPDFRYGPSYCSEAIEFLYQDPSPDWVENDIWEMLYGVEVIEYNRSSLPGYILRDTDHVFGPVVGFLGNVNGNIFKVKNHCPEDSRSIEELTDDLTDLLSRIQPLN